MPSLFASRNQSLGAQVLLADIARVGVGQTVCEMVTVRLSIADLLAMFVRVTERVAVRVDVPDPVTDEDGVSSGLVNYCPKLLRFAES